MVQKRNVKPQEHSLGVQASWRAAGICRHAVDKTGHYRITPDGLDNTNALELENRWGQ